MTQEDAVQALVMAIKYCMSLGPLDPELLANSIVTTLMNMGVVVFGEPQA